MLRLLPLAPAIGIVVVAFRVVALRCGRKPALRLRFIAGGVGILCLAALLVPWVLVKLEPPLSESPAGLLVILGKVLLVGFLSLVAVGTLLGAAFPVRKWRVGWLLNPGRRSLRELALKGRPHQGRGTSCGMGQNSALKH